MKKIFTFTSTLYSILLVMLLTVLASVGYAAPQAVETNLLFKGSMQGLETRTGERTFTGLGSGNATLLGKFMVQYEYNEATEDISAMFVAANGDLIYAEGYRYVDSDVGGIFEDYHITGGTGRFAHAIGGEFMLERVFTDGSAGTSGTFYGNIVIRIR